MADEKRIKLGVDIGELGNQLLQINNLVEKNYNLAIQGQERYNTILETSIKLLDTQSSKIQEISDLLEKAGNASQNLVPNAGGQNQIMPPPIGVGGGGINNSSNEGNNTADLDTFHDDVLDKFDKLISKTGSIEAGVDLILDPFVKIQEDVSEILNEIRNPGSGGGGGSAGGRGGSAGGNSSNSGASGGGGNDSLNSLGNGFNRGAGLAMQKNEVYMLAAASALIPVVGQGISMVLSKILKDAEELDTQNKQYYSVTGEYGGLGNFNYLGLSTAEALRKQSEYKRANVNLSSSDLEFEKGFGISGGGMSSLLQSTRNDVSNDMYTSGQMGARYLSYLTSAISPRQVRSYSEEYLKILVDLNQQQLEQVGYTNSLVNSEIVQGIAKLDDSFQNPAVLQRVISSLQSGLMNANSPQLEALQFSSLQKIKPNASYFELLKARENPFSAENAEYLNQYLKDLSSIGTDEEGFMNVASAFGISNTLAEKIVREARTKWKNGEMFYGQDFKNIQNEYNVAQEAINSTSQMQQLTARTTDLSASIGTPVMNLTSKATNVVMGAIEEVVSFLGDSKTGIGAFVSSIGEAETAVDKFAVTLTNLSSYLGGGVSETGVVEPKQAANIINNQKSVKDKLNMGAQLGILNMVGAFIKTTTK